MLAIQGCRYHEVINIKDNQYKLYGKEFLKQQKLSIDVIITVNIYT